MRFSADELDDIRARTRLSDLFADAGVRFKGAGKHRVRFAVCPFHAERTGSFKVDDGRQFFHCFGCAAHGDCFDAVMRLYGCSFPDAVERLGGAREITAEDRRKLQERKQALAAEDKRSADRDRDTVERMFRNASPFEGSPAEKYLLGRGVHPFKGMATDLRFAKALEYRGYKDARADETEPLGKFPAMLAAIRNRAGEIIGIHRTYLDAKEPKKLEPPGDPRRNGAKKILGEVTGGMIRLSPPAPVLVIGEGIETSLSAFQLGIGGDEAAVAAGVSLGNLAGRAEAYAPHPKHPDDPHRTIPNGEPDMDFPGVDLPNEVDHVIVIGDGDSEPIMTRAQLHVAGKRFRELERLVEIVMAPSHRDMNNLLAETRKGIETAVPTPVAFEHFSEEFSKIAKPIRKSRFGRLSFRDLDKPGPELAYIVDDLITAHEKFMIAGETQSGKSFLGVDLGMCIATKRPFFGNKILKPGLVIYQAGEGANGIKNRLRAYRDHFNLDRDARIPFELLQSKIDLFAPNGDVQPLIDECLWIASEYPDLPLVSIFIDTFSKAQGAADEISGKDMNVILGNADKIVAATGAALGFIHHMNAGGSKVRGHTSLVANIDQLITVEHDKESNVRTAHLSKQKDGETGLISKFELLSVVIAKRDDGKDVTSCVCTVLGEKAAEKAAARQGMFELTGPNKIKAFKALLEALRLNARPGPAKCRAPAWAEVVTLTEWRDEMLRKEAVGEDSPETVLERVKARRDAAVDALTKVGLIETDAGYVWRTKRRVAGFDRPEGRAKVEGDPEASAPLREPLLDIGDGDLAF